MKPSSHKILCQYSAYLRRIGHVEAAATVLRIGSRDLLDVIAYIATYDKYTVKKLRELINSSSLEGFEFRPDWLATLGRVSILLTDQEHSSEQQKIDVEFGYACLEIGNQRLPKTPSYSHLHRMQVEMLTEQGRVQEATRLTEENLHLRDNYYGYLAADLLNPVYQACHRQSDMWLAAFNRPFVENNILGVSYPSSNRPTFNDLATPEPSPIYGGPKVSIIMTCYQPVWEEVTLAVHSILRQSWQNFELIIVDDASPRELYEPVLNKIESLDPRIHMIRLSVNGGTYKARNVGFEVATGKYVTGQDSDDWSHPQRLEYQVEHLIQSPTSPGVMVEAIRADSDLVRMAPGRVPNLRCEVSLMVHTTVAKEVGGYMQARKGADTEFRRRIERYMHQTVDAIDKPLYLIRVGHKSLSRGDFKPGWSHPARRAFWNASYFWHQNSSRSQLRLKKRSAPPIPVPNKFKITPVVSQRTFDYVFIGDWRECGGRQRAFLDEIRVLNTEHTKIGVMQLESPLGPTNTGASLAAEIQILINDEEVAEIIPDESVKTRLAIINDPTIMQFRAIEKTKLTSDITLITPDLAPPSENSTHFFYLPDECDSNAKHHFQGKTIWTTSDPSILKMLQHWEPTIQVLPMLKPIALDIEKWTNTRQRLLSDLPVTGRTSENFDLEWPAHSKNIETLWPFDSGIDIYVLGEAQSLLRKFHYKTYPPSWTVFRNQDISAPAFMSSLDFFVYYPDSSLSKHLSREALEAAASGALVVLPLQFRLCHENSAIYADPDEALEIQYFYSRNKDAFVERTRANFEALKKLPILQGYTRFIEGVLTNISETTQKELD